MADAAQVMASIEAECLAEKLFLGTVNARAVVLAHLTEAMRDCERAGMERAAKIAASHNPQDVHRDDHYKWRFVAEEVAAAIRAEKDGL